MTFRELMVDEEAAVKDVLLVRPAFRRNTEKPAWEAVLENNGPVMTVWFLAMLVNILGLAFLF